MGMLRPTFLKDGTMLVIDDFGNLSVNRVRPLDVLREKGCIFFLGWLRTPLLRWATVVRLGIIVYRRIERDRASKLPFKLSLECVCAHTPNDRTERQPPTETVERTEGSR
jgi:hypothetical protein